MPLSWDEIKGRTLDKAVDAAYGKRTFTTDADRVAFLFERYLELTQSPLEEVVKKAKAPRRTKEKGEPRD